MGEVSSDVPEVMRRSVCPTCSRTVEVECLNYNRIYQHTESPSGHKVQRQWNGPERHDYVSGVDPYGWSEWRREGDE